MKMVGMVDQEREREREREREKERKKVRMIKKLCSLY